MLGIPVPKQRDRMSESLDVILRLMAGEVVTEQTEWYTDHNQEFIGKAISAATETVQKHFAEQAAKQQLKH